MNAETHSAAAMVVAPDRLLHAARGLRDLLAWLRDKLERLSRDVESALVRDTLHALLRACDPATNPRLLALLAAADLALAPMPPARRWTIRKVPLSLNRILRRHWSVRRREARAWRLQVRAACGRPIVRTAVRVALEIVVYRRRPQDPDNAVASLKPILDALVREGWLRDDATAWLELSSYEVLEPDRSLERTELLWTPIVDQAVTPTRVTTTASTPEVKEKMHGKGPDDLPANQTLRDGDQPSPLRAR